LASDLHELLRVANVSGPYVLADTRLRTYALVYAEDYYRCAGPVSCADRLLELRISFDLPD